MARSCAICCDEDIPVGSIEPAVTQFCEHERTCCDGCLSRYLHEECVAKGKLTSGVKCLAQGCSALLSDGEIRRYARPETIEQVDRIGVRAAFEKDPEFIECSNAHCPFWYLNAGGHKMPIVKCIACGTKTCFIHKMRWHDNLTCDMYDRTQDDKALTVQDRSVQRCPNCAIPIQKTGGCNHMVCDAAKGCGKQFNWKA